VLRIFGCPAYVHVQSGECSKLDSKLRKCICLGLSNVKGYRIWDLVSEKGNFRRDVVLDEVYMLRKAEDEASTNSQKGKQVVKVELDDQRSLMDVCDDQFSRDSQHQEEPYSLARGKEKSDRKVP
jgi:DNA primase catalytic subunit